MKKVSMLMVIVMIVLSACFASAAEEQALAEQKVAVESKPEPMFGVSGELWLRSAYIGDDGGVYYKGFVAQPCITISHNPSGLSAGVWASIAPGKSPTSENGAGDDNGNEFDILANWDKKIKDTTVGLSYSYYKLFPLNKWGQGDIHSFSVKVGYDLTDKITPYAKLIYDCVVEKTDQDGFVYRIGLNLNLYEHLKIDASIGGHGPIFGAREELISSGKVSVSFPYDIVKDNKTGKTEDVEKLFTIIPEITYQKRFGYAKEDGGLSEDILLISIGCTF